VTNDLGCSRERILFPTDISLDTPTRLAPRAMLRIMVPTQIDPRNCTIPDLTDALQAMILTAISSTRLRLP
jgi:hypothetical protein